MKGVYPVFVKKANEDYLVFVPDMEIYTEGKDFYDAIEMARDAIGLKGINLEDDEVELPQASTQEEAMRKAEEDADEDMDFSDGVLTFVDVDFSAYKNKVRNKAVKKNCTIPYWMSVQADRMGVNYSRLLQDAILGVIENAKA
ncbi:MAG: type II toxin-antitoxin system HicB family antitoxin [Clostridiales bacterium]|nr:type II toxin-antitoxin system HicB family antitoxin [Clostridiales bacterium]